MGGFLLGGGIGYNHDAWGGLARHNIQAADVVTAAVEQLRVSSRGTPGFVVALRGGGMGFPAVVTRLQLSLYPMPKSVMETAVIFPIGHLETAITPCSPSGRPPGPLTPN